MRSTGPTTLICFALLIISVSAQGGHLSEQRRQYEYERSYAGGGAGPNGCGDCQTGGTYGKMTDMSGPAWIQQQREEMQRRMQQFHQKINNGGMSQSHYQKYHSSASGGTGPDCKQHQSSSVRKMEERQHVLPTPMMHQTRKFEESRNSHQVPIPESSYRFNKEIEERRGQTVVPMGGHMRRFFEEQRRQQVHQPPPVVSEYSKKFEEERRNVMQPPPVTYKMEKKFEEERRNVVQPPPVTYKRKKVEERKNSQRVAVPVLSHVSQRVESHQTDEQIPVYGNSYFSISQADRHRQHAQHFPQVYSKHHLEESSSQHRQPQPTRNYKKTEKIEESKFQRQPLPDISTVHKHSEDRVFNQHVVPQVPGTHVIKEIEYEDTHHYNKQYEKKADEVHHEYQRITFPTWVQKQSDRLIYEEYYRQSVTPQEYGRNLTRTEEDRFYEYYNRQGGTTLNEIKEDLRQQIVYPSYLVSTEEKKFFEEFYLSRVGLVGQARNLTTYELEEFEDYYREKLAAEIQEKDHVYRAKHYNLQYPRWVVVETDKKIFEEYYFSHVPESEYGRELTKDERVEFEVYYNEKGGSTDHNVETYDHSGYRIVYPDWVITTEDRAIYEEYYKSVAGESYGRELSEDELFEFEEYYRTHGGTTKHETAVEDLSLLSYKVNYPSWIVTQVDRVIFEEFYRIHVSIEDYGRELSMEELLQFEEYYKQRGGSSRHVLEETLFMRLSYPSWLRNEYDRSMYREFYLRLVYVEDYGRYLTEEESAVFVEYYDRHTKGQYETLRGQTDYQWVYPSFVVTRSDRRIYNEYYNQCMESKLDLGRELVESEKIEFQQFFIEKGGLYEYRYTREEYLLTFELDRSIGGSAYQWTWDGVEHMAAELTHLVASSPDVHHTDEYDKKVYGSTKEEELPPPPPPTTTTTTERPKKTVISKDRGDQPPQQYEEDVETEPGIGPYEPEPAPIVEPRPQPPPRPDHYESGHRSKYEHHEEHAAAAAPVGYSEYRRRYEHKRTQSRVVPGGSHMSSMEDLGNTDHHLRHESGHAGHSEHSSSNHQRTLSSNLDGQYELIDQDMKPAASSHNQHWVPDNISGSEEIEPDNPDLMSEDEYENVDLDYQEDQKRRVA